MIDNPFATIERRLNHLEGLISDLSKSVHLATQQRPATPGPEKPVTANELAAVLQTTVENIHRQKAKGTIPYRKMGGRVYFLLSEVLAAMQKGGGHE